MKLCFSTLGCPDWTLEQVAENGATYGFDGVELRIYGDRHVDPGMDINQRRETRNLFAAHGLVIPIISGYTQFSGDDTAELESNSEALIRNAELAADLQVPYLRAFPGMQGAFSTKGMEILSRSCDRVHSLGVKVLMEIHGHMKTGKQAANLLTAVDSPGLGILWDTHHSLSVGETIDDTWQAIGRHVYHVHIKDATPDHHPCLMGKGNLPVPDITALLKRNGYNGYYSFEWEKTWIPELEDPEIALPAYVAYMRELPG